MWFYFRMSISVPGIGDFCLFLFYIFLRREVCQIYIQFRVFMWTRQPDCANCIWIRFYGPVFAGDSVCNYLCNFSIFVINFKLLNRIICFQFGLRIMKFYFIIFGDNRLWQDAENRNLLTSLLKKNSAQVLISSKSLPFDLGADWLLSSRNVMEAFYKWRNWFYPYLSEQLV